MQMIFKYFRKREWMMAGASLAFIVLQVFLDLKLPDYMSRITTLVQTEGSAMTGILRAGGMMLLCALGSIVASVTVGYFAARIASSLAQRLRELMFDKTLSFSMEEMNRFSTASLITRSTNDITQIQTVVAMGLQVMVKAPIMAVWAAAKIWGKSWQWTALTGGAVVALLLIVGITVVFAIPRFKVVQKLTDSLNGVTRENLTGLRVVRAYNAEEYQQEKFEKVNSDLTATNLFVNRVMAVMQPGMSLIMSSLTLGIYWIGAVLIGSAGTAAQLGLFSDMVVFSSYAVQIVMSFMMLAMIFIMLPRASVSAGRVEEVLRTQPAIRDGELQTGVGKGTVEFRGVSFQYPDAAEKVLENVSFRAEAGETVAFIGSTGSGKSTLVNLIPRFYDATEGEVFVDGINVKEYGQQALRERIGYVSQKAVLFSGSVRSNVACGGETASDDERIREAVGIAQGTEFVESLEKGYDGPVAQGGGNFSGGQKQRISIARAIYKRPEILIFDDSFSALDYKTDRMLRAALAEKTAGSTCLIVAQRISTIRQADKIIVLDEGKVTGMGTHEELMENCPVYQEIAYSQLSKEELNVG